MNVYISSSLNSHPRFLRAPQLDPIINSCHATFFSNRLQSAIYSMNKIFRRDNHMSPDERRNLFDEYKIQDSTIDAIFFSNFFQR